MTPRTSLSRLLLAFAALTTLGSITAACSTSTSSSGSPVTTVAPDTTPATTASTTATTTTAPATTTVADHDPTGTIDLQAFYDGCDDYTDLVTELRGTEPESSSNAPLTEFTSDMQEGTVTSRMVACTFLFDGDTFTDQNRIQITAAQVDQLDDAALAVIWELPGGDSTPLKGIGDEAAYTHKVFVGELQDSTQALIGNTVIRISVYMPEDAPGADHIDQKSLTTALTTLLDTIGA